MDATSVLAMQIVSTFILTLQNVEPTVNRTNCACVKLIENWIGFPKLLVREHMLQLRQRQLHQFFGRLVLILPK